MLELDRILSIRQAAEMMGVTDNAIYLRIRRKTIKPNNPGGRPSTIKLSEIVRVLDGGYDPSVPSGIDVDPDSALSRLLTYHETMQYMGISISTLSNRIGHGKRPRPIRCAKGCSEKWMFRLADIIDAMDNPNARTPEERACGEKISADKKAANKTKYDIQYEVIKAQCPTCGDRFSIKVVKGSSKWIYCHLHAYHRFREDRVSVTGYDHNYL